MGDVIDLQEYLPHSTGPCVCLQCRHEWIGVVPVRVNSIKCPECGTFKGCRAGLIIPADSALLICPACDNELNYALAAGRVLCACCGTLFDFPE